MIPIFSMVDGQDYRVVAIDAPPPAIRVGDIVRVQWRNGHAYRKNVTKGREDLMYYTAPTMWVEPVKKEASK